MESIKMMIFIFITLICAIGLPFAIISLVHVRKLNKILDEMEEKYKKLVNE